MNIENPYHEYNIFYMLEGEPFRKFITGVEIPQLSELHKTHNFVKKVYAKNLDDVYEQMQGENWSPNGEARGLIKSLGLSHTSMSVGDVIYGVNPNEDAELPHLRPARYHVVRRFGFTPLSQMLGVKERLLDPIFRGRFGAVNFPDTTNI